MQQLLRNTLSYLRTLLVSIPLVVACTIVMGLAVIAGSMFGSSRAFADRVMRRWARVLLAASFVHVRVSGLDRLGNELGRTRSCVFCANHLSYMDPPVLVASLPARVRFFAKESLFRIPIFGWAMRRMGHVSIDRENPRAAARSLARASAQFHDGTSAVIFPEGGRSETGSLESFHGGAMHLAIQLQIPVVPVAILGTRAVLPPGSIHIRGGQVRVMLGEPIPTHGLKSKDRHQLAARVRQAIERLAEVRGDR